MNSAVWEADAGSGVRISNGSYDLDIEFLTINESGADNGIVVNDSHDISLYYNSVYEADGGSGIVINNGSYDINSENNSIYEHGLGNGFNVTDSSYVNTSWDYIEEYDDGFGIDINNSSTIKMFYPGVFEYGDGAAARITNLSNDVIFYGQYMYEHDNGIGINILNSSNIGLTWGGYIYEGGANNGLHADGVTNLAVNGLYVNSENGGDAVLIENSNTIDIGGLYAYWGGTANGATFTNNTGPLTIADTEVDYYAGYGIYITGQTGDMLLDGLYLYANGLNGIEVNGSTGSFTMQNSFVYYSGGTGVEVTAMGDVTLDNVVSDYNNDFGANLDVSGNISVANSTFYNNFNESGLAAWGGGTFTSTNSTFEWNCMYGLMVAVAGDISVSGAMVDYNVLCGAPNTYGAELNSDSNINVTTSQFNNNFSGAGLVAGNSGGLTTLVSHSTANGNGMDGFALFGNTVVTALGVTAMGNVNSGIYVNNLPTVPVNIFASNMYNNGEYGIDYTLSSGILKLCADYYSGNPLGDYGAGAGATVIDYMYYPCANPGEVTSGAGGAGGETGVARPAIVEVPYVADFATETAQPGSTAFDAALGLIFQLIETAEDGIKTLWAQASIPAGLVPDGTAATFLQKAGDELPAALPDDSTFVGPAFTLGFGGLTETSGNMQIKMRLTEGFTVPAGQSLAVLVYDSTGTWVTLPTIVADGFATAYTNALGTFVLALVTP